MPMACITKGSRAIHETRRGEYAIAPNWTVTKARANTIPVRASMPEATEESMAIATGAVIGLNRPGNH
jgi:hypothetical protein